MVTGARLTSPKPDVEIPAGIRILTGGSPAVENVHEHFNETLHFL